MDITRRGFLRTVGAGAGIATGIESLGMPMEAPKQEFHLQRRGLLDLTRFKAIKLSQKTIFVRRRLNSWSADDFSAYQTGVAAMKARPESDPTSWLFQANIHGKPSSDPNSNPAWSKCQHGTIHFLSWHRMYLYWFERIIRKASGDPSFALGYWRYDPDDDASRVLPEAFRLPATDANALYVPNRLVNGGDPIPGSSATHDGAFARLTFLSAPSFGFQSSLEGTPHGAVHVSIGSLMGSVPTAARDPIFWTHHANIDRLWKRWLSQGGGRDNPISDSAFMNTAFSFFDENGGAVSLSGKDILDTIDQLDYKYDDDPCYTQLFASSLLRRDVKMPEPVRLLNGPEPSFTLAGQRVAQTIKLPEAERGRLNAIIENIQSGKDGDLILSIEGLAAKAPPNVTYEVFLNLPDNEQQPDFRSPFFVGVLAPFGLDEGGEHHAHMEGDKSVQFSISSTVSQLKKLGSWKDDEMHIVLVPRMAGIKPGESIKGANEISFKRITVLSQ